MKIAVISDLHFGSGARSCDLCPITLQKKNDTSSDSHYRQHFFEFIRGKDITADYLLVPGDVTDSGHPMEASLANDFLREAGKVLTRRQDRLLFVPGNHDIAWDMLDAHDTTGIKWSHRYMALNSDKFMFSKINEMHKNGNLFAEQYFKLWKFKDLIVLGYNSSATDTSSDKGKCGNIDQSHLDSMVECLKKNKIKDDKRLKIFLVHHHLRNFKLPHTSDRDYSVSNNAESIVTVLQNYKFDFIVHGHQHYSHFDFTNSKIPILCSGSFSARIDSLWSGFILNQFHLIDFEWPKHDKNRLRGEIQSWSYVLDGWVPSPNPGATSGGEPYKRAFGFSLSDDKLMKLASRRLMKLLDKRATFSWGKDVVSKVADLEFLSNSIEDIKIWCEKCIGNKCDIFVKDDGDIFFVVKLRKGGR